MHRLRRQYLTDHCAKIKSHIVLWGASHCEIYSDLSVLSMLLLNKNKIYNNLRGTHKK